MPGGALSAVVLALALAALTVLGWRALEAVTHARRRATLRALRVATALMALCVAIQPTLSGERTQRSEGRLAVLFDASRSMSVRARGGQARAQDAASLAGRWASEGRSVDVYTFGRHLDAARMESVAGGIDASQDDTRLAEALDQATQGGDIGAVVVVSDGADHGAAALEAATRLGIRVHGVAVGADQAIRDDAVAALRADSVAFLRRAARVRVTLRRIGGSESTVPVVLSRDGERLRETSVVLPADGEAEVEFSFTPDRLGRSVYRVSIPLPDGDIVPENNERAFLVRVVRDNLRVLLVAGQPSWDQRFLRAFLSRDPTTDLISFFILRSTSDMTMADADELALIPFPTDELFNEHLGSFDVVLFQNFEYAPYQMAGYLPRIRDYVMRGGSFAMIGGPLSFAAAGYAETPIAEILPVEVLPRGTPEARAITTDRFRPRIAEGAERHPVLGLLPEPRANAEAWAALDPLQGLNVVRALRPGAQLLLAHPTQSAPSGEPLPVMVAGSAGRGRVLALMTDTSWHWGIATAGQTGDASAYERFWDRTIRWLTRDPALDPARVSTDRESYGPGAPVAIEAALNDERYQPIAARGVRLAIQSSAGRELEAADSRTDAEGGASVTLPAPTTPGGYRVVATLAGADEPLADEVFVVESGGDELADPRPRPDFLEELSRATEGSFSRSPEGASDLSEFDATRVRSLGTTTERPFASAWAFLLLMALLGTEWIARRRWGST